MSETPRTNEHAEWLRRRAASPYYALARSGLLDSANAIERLEFNFAALRAENERLERERYELAHAIWHALDDSCEDMSSGEITIMRSDYDRLCSLVPDDHEELHKRFDPSVAAAEKEPRNGS